MDDVEKEKIRAAFGYMGPRTQAGLTLEALAKGAGILLKTAQEETALLRAEVEKWRQNSVDLENICRLSASGREAAELQNQELQKKLAAWWDCGCLSTSDCVDHDHDDFITSMEKPKCPACGGRGTMNIGEPHGVVPCALCAEKREQGPHERQSGYREIRCEECHGLIALHMCPRANGGSGGAVKRERPS